MKILSIFGTRPEAIKLAPIIKKIENNKKITLFSCVTAQHRQMLDQVLSLFEIKPDHDLNIMRQGQDLFDLSCNILSEIMDKIECNKQVQDNNNQLMQNAEVNDDDLSDASSDLYSDIEDNNDLLKEDTKEEER